MAHQAKLEGPRMTTKCDALSQVSPPSFKIVEESNALQDQPLHPLNHALQLFTDASKEEWTSHLNNHTPRGNLVPSQKQTTHK